MNDATYISLVCDSNDIYYRYKMPKLTAKIEGSGNSIKTVITNMSVVAKALNRPPTYPTKYFSYELGAQVKMDVDRDEFIVSGAHDPEKLLTLLYSFIGKFVLCAKCKNPETQLEVVQKTISQICQACGHHEIIPNTIHRLTSFIVNHPPTKSATTAVISPSLNENGSDNATAEQHRNNINQNEDDNSFNIGKVDRLQLD